MRLYLFGKVGDMNIKSFMQQATPDEREALAKAVGSSVGYLYLLAGGHRRPSVRMCRKLVEAEPRFVLSELRSDIWAPKSKLPEAEPA